MERLDCVVPPEWAAALAGVGDIAHLQAALARPDLWLECQLLDKLLYKNANQHRGSQHFQRLQEVRRLLDLLRAQQLDRQVGALQDALAAARRRGALPSGGLLLAYGGDQRRVPSHQAAAGVLCQLAAACHLIEQLGPAVHRASLQLLAQLAHSFFMPLCLTALATLARVQVLAGQLMLDAVQAYNCIAEAAALLPPSPAAAREGQLQQAGAEASQPASQQPAATQQQQDDLPQLLRAQWRRGLPVLERVPCAPGDSLAEQAAAACRRYALHVLQPEQQAGPPASLVVLEEGPAPAPAGRGAPRGSNAAAAGQRRQQRGGRQGMAAAAAAAAPVLAVMEDRGVPISRTAFAAAAAGTAAGSAAAVAAQAPADEAAAGAEDEAAAGAAVPGPAGAAASAAGSAPLLLGVVEDAGVLAEVQEDAGGTVASLMAGETRGHLYRRAATLGLGQAPPAAQPKPAAPAQTGPATLATAPAAAAKPPAPAPAAPEPPEPVAAQAPASAAFVSAARPAFVAVAASAPAQPAAARPAAPRPAFLAAGSPAAKADTQPASAAAASPPAQQPAGSSALETGSRKRKKPAAPARAAAGQQQQQADAADAPAKSWEDWLQSLAAPAASPAAPAGQHQRQQTQQGRGRGRSQQQERGRGGQQHGRGRGQQQQQAKRPRGRY